MFISPQLVHLGMLFPHMEGSFSYNSESSSISSEESNFFNNSIRLAKNSTIAHIYAVRDLCSYNRHFSGRAYFYNPPLAAPVCQTQSTNNCVSKTFWPWNLLSIHDFSLPSISNLALTIFTLPTVWNPPCIRNLDFVVWTYIIKNYNKMNHTYQKYSSVLWLFPI